MVKRLFPDRMSVLTTAQEVKLGHIRVSLVKEDAQMSTGYKDDNLSDCACSTGSILDVDKLEFVNRVEELDKVYSETSAQKWVIDAPAGYGKTYFLKRVIEIKRGTWNCRYVDLHRDKLTRENIIATLSDHAAHTEQEFAAYIAKANRTFLLCVDTCEKQKENVKYIREILVPAIEQRLAGHAHGLRVIFAGRYITRHDTDWESYSYLKLKLTRFEEKAVRDLLMKLNGDQVHQKLDEYVREILLLSGGHPNAIRQLAEYAVRQSQWTINWDKDRQQLFNTYIQGIVEQILDEIPDQERQRFINSNIFRKLHTSTLKALSDRAIIEKADDNMAVIKRWCNEGLIQIDSSSGSYSDGFNRSLLLVEVRLKNPEKYYAMNQTAYEIYDQWLHQGIAGRIRDTDLCTFIMEAIYHFLLSKPQLSWDELQVVINKYFGTDILLTSHEPESLPLLKLQVRSRFEEDNEIQAILREQGLLKETIALFTKLSDS